jgi:hypothetical protein
VSEDVKLAHPEVAWREISGIRVLVPRWERRAYRERRNTSIAFGRFRQPLVRSAAACGTSFVR